MTLRLCNLFDRARTVVERKDDGLAAGDGQVKATRSCRCAARCMAAGGLPGDQHERPSTESARFPSRFRPTEAGPRSKTRSGDVFLLFRSTLSDAAGCDARVGRRPGVVVFRFPSPWIESGRSVCGRLFDHRHAAVVYSESLSEHRGKLRDGWNAGRRDSLGDDRTIRRQPLFADASQHETRFGDCADRRRGLCLGPVGASSGTAGLEWQAIVAHLGPGIRRRAGSLVSRYSVVGRTQERPLIGRDGSVEYRRE